jgi:hypothetical protein
MSVQSIDNIVLSAHSGTRTWRRVRCSSQEEISPHATRIERRPSCQTESSTVLDNAINQMSRAE